MVSCTAIEVQIVFKMLLALVAGQLAIAGQLEERSTHGVLGCFLRAGDGGSLEEGFLVDKATEDRFALLWEAMTEPEVEAFPCFRK